MTTGEFGTLRSDLRPFRTDMDARFAALRTDMDTRFIGLEAKLDEKPSVATIYQAGLAMLDAMFAVILVRRGIEDPRSDFPIAFGRIWPVPLLRHLSVGLNPNIVAGLRHIGGGLCRA